MRRWIQLFIALLITSLLVTIAVADTGCFLERESEYYCTEVDEETADFECSLFDNCELKNTFAEEERCVYFEECEEILCQSSCEYTLAGLCESGEVPAGEEELWCESEGCCRYWSEDNDIGCQVEENKWQCHIAARNAGAENLNWDQSLTETSCSESCLAEEYPITTELEEFDIEFYSENIQSVSTEESEESTTGSEETVNGESEQSIQSKIASILAPFFLLFIIVLIFIFFYEHRHTILKEYEKVSKIKKRKKKKEEEISPKRTRPKNLPSPQLPIFQPLRHVRHHKKQHAIFELEKSFGSYLPKKEIIISKKSSMRKLQHLVRRHTRKLGRRKRRKENLQKAFEKEQK